MSKYSVFILFYIFALSSQAEVTEPTNEHGGFYYPRVAAASACADNKGSGCTQYSGAPDYLWAFKRYQCEGGSVAISNNAYSAPPCTVTVLWTVYEYSGSDISCPNSSDTPDANGLCPEYSACELGQITADCAVQCDAISYSYYHNGIKKFGKIAAGQVGHGQSCPTPSYPSGTDSGQVCTSSNENDCLDGAYHESENVQEQNTETTTVDNGDGTSTTTTTTTQGGSSGSQNSAPVGSSTGTLGKNDRGQTVESDSSSALNRGISDNQVEIGGEKYQLCNHGGIVSGPNLCDYTPDSCGVNQVPTDGFGCYDLPVAEPPPPNTPGQTTTTNTDANGNTTTTTTTTSGTTTGGGTPTETDEEAPVDLGDPTGLNAYTPGEDTFQGALSDFSADISAAPISAAMTNFFTFTANGSCPIWSVSAWVFDITIDQFCSPSIPWGLISGMIIAVALLVAGRIAFT